MYNLVKESIVKKVFNNNKNSSETTSAAIK